MKLPAMYCGLSLYTWWTSAPPCDGIASDLLKSLGTSDWKSPIFLSSLPGQRTPNLIASRNMNWQWIWLSLRLRWMWQRRYNYLQYSYSYAECLPFLHVCVSTNCRWLLYSISLYNYLLQVIVVNHSSVQDAVQTVGYTWQVSGVLGAGRSLAECSRSSQLRLCWTSSTSLSDIALSERERERVSASAQSRGCNWTYWTRRLKSHTKQSINYLHWSLMPMEEVMTPLNSCSNSNIWHFMLVHNTQLS